MVKMSFGEYSVVARQGAWKSLQKSEGVKAKAHGLEKQSSLSEPGRIHQREETGRRL